MGFYPYNDKGQGSVATDAGPGTDQSVTAHLAIPAAAAIVASTTGVRAAVASTGSPLTITGGITNPAVPRNITATAGGTATDIKAIAVTITGTDPAGAAQTETLPPFTVDTAGTVTGSKAFATVTSIGIPAHDGTGATTAIGFGNKFGLPNKLPHNTVLGAYLNNVKEATAPTVTVSSTVLGSNGFTLNSTPNGTPIDVYYLV